MNGGAHDGTSRGDPTPVSTRDVARALVLATWLVACVISAFPEHVPTAAELAEPAVRQRFEGLIGVARTFGVTGGPDDVAREIVGAQRRVLEAKHALLVPFAWALEPLRLAQQWTMFANVDRMVDRLVVEIQPLTGERRVLFRAGDPAHQELAAFLLDRRVSALWHVPLGGVAPELVRVVDALEGRVFARHSDAHGLLVHVEAVPLDGGDPADRFITGRARPAQYGRARMP